MRIREHEKQIGPIERHVIVSPVPYDDFRFLFSLVEDGRIIDAGKNNEATNQEMLKFFHFLNRTVVLFHIIDAGKPLNLLLHQIPVWHGVTDHHNVFAKISQNLCDPPGCLTLATTGSHGSNGNDRLPGFDHGLVGAQQREVGSFSQDL